MSIKGNWRRHGSEVVIRWCQRFFFSPLRDSPLRRSILSPQREKKPLAPRVTRSMRIIKTIYNSKSVKHVSTFLIELRLRGTIENFK